MLMWVLAPCAFSTSALIQPSQHPQPCPAGMGGDFLSTAYEQTTMNVCHRADTSILSHSPTWYSRVGYYNTDTKALAAKGDGTWH